jgi:hypothetical protein
MLDYRGFSVALILYAFVSVFGRIHNHEKRIDHNYPATGFRFERAYVRSSVAAGSRLTAKGSNGRPGGGGP